MNHYFSINENNWCCQRKIDRIIVTLNHNEINKLKELVDLPCELENIRKWFLLGLNIGQRISDVLKITPQNLRQAPNGGMYLDLNQIKTKKSITVGIIDPTVLEFLRRDFPQRTNASVFNKKIKELCRLAGIDQVIKGNKMSSVTKRVAFGMYPKYELITSHTMRRSFATNYFTKIEGPSFFAGPLLDFLPAFFAEFGSNGIVYILLKTSFR